MVSEDSTAVTLPVLGDLTYRELHSFEHGLYSGLVEGSRPTEYRDGREKHYWRMGYIPMMMLRYTVVLLAGIGLINI